MKNLNKIIVAVYIALLSVSLNAQINFIANAKEKMNKAGLDLAFDYKGEFYSNVDGGMGNENFYLDNFDIVLNADLEKLFNWKGALFNVYVLGNNGDVPSDIAGAAQGISNIAAHDTWKIYELWLEQSFGDDFSLLAGLYDLNSEFDTRESSGIFINPSHGIGPEFAMTGDNGPSIFPTTSLALRLKYNPTEISYIQAALFDGIPGNVNNPNGTQIELDGDDGLLLAVETGFLSTDEPFTENYFKIGLGGWYYTKDFEDLTEIKPDNTPVLHSGNYGLYLSGEKNIYSEGSGAQGMTAFLRLGLADDNINQFDYYFGTGFTYIGLIPGRDEDVFGLAIASAHNCSKFIDANFSVASEKPESLETIIELTYEFKVNELLRIQPDIQYVINPTFSTEEDRSLIMGARVSVSL